MGYGVEDRVARGRKTGARFDLPLFLDCVGRQDRVACIRGDGLLAMVPCDQ